MIRVAFYSKGEDGVYDRYQDTITVKSEEDARIRAMALNWAYTIIAIW